MIYCRVFWTLQQLWLTFEMFYFIFLLISSNSNLHVTFPLLLWLTTTHSLRIGKICPSTRLNFIMLHYILQSFLLKVLLDRKGTSVDINMIHILDSHPFTPSSSPISSPISSPSSSPPSSSPNQSSNKLFHKYQKKRERIEF